MPSRLVTRAARSNPTVTLTAGRTADPAIHGATDPEGIDGKEPTQAEIEPNQNRHQTQTDKQTDPFNSQKPPFASSPRLKSTGVNQPLDPSTQQKRHNTKSALLQDLTCAGFDGSPLPNADEEQNLNQKRKEQEEDDKEYFKHHKPSPLAEIEVADTRKPITRATDGTAGSGEYGGTNEVIGWLPEQIDTAEEALLRATRIWRESTVRGDPDSPQSRVLRALRGEEDEENYLY